MCWNEEISFMTGLLTTVISGYTFKRNKNVDRYYSISLFVIGLMQWIEFALWIQLKKYPEREHTNKMLTRYGVNTVLALQPLTFIYGYKFTNIKVPYFIKYIYTFYAIFVFLINFNQNKTYIVKYKDQNTLQWGSQKKIKKVRKIGNKLHYLIVTVPFVIPLIKSDVKMM